MATANQAILEWDANTEPDLAGYRLYFGQYISGAGTCIFTGMKQVGLVTTTTLQSEFTWDGPWYVGISAFDTSNNESPIAFNVAITKHITRTGSQLIARR